MCFNHSFVLGSDRGRLIVRVKESLVTHGRGGGRPVFNCLGEEKTVRCIEVVTMGCKGEMSGWRKSRFLIYGENGNL